MTSGSTRPTLLTSNSGSGFARSREPTPQLRPATWPPSASAVSTGPRAYQSLPTSTGALSPSTVSAPPYRAQGIPELADQHWSALPIDRFGTPIATRAARELAQLRYSEGQRAAVAMDYPRAVFWLERLRPDVHLLRRRDADHALFTLAQAHKQLEHWDQAADLFRLLAGPDCDLSYLALYELGDCALEAGRYEAALKAFTDYINRFPDSGLVLHCEHRISVAQHMLGQRDATERQSAPDPEEGTGR